MRSRHTTFAPASERCSFPPLALIASAVGVLLALVLAIPAPARAATNICPLGTGAGQCEEPNGLAVDEETGRLYVADTDNDRVDVFDVKTGDFLFAFGWGVADGTSPEPQTCTTKCFQGLGEHVPGEVGHPLGEEGGGAGEFSHPTGIAVDNDPASPAHHDIYVSEAGRVQRFAPSGAFLAAWGGGVVSAGARGTGDLTTGSKTITNVEVTEKAFAVSQTITGTGIPVGTKITALGRGTITLSKAATATAAAEALSVAEGSGITPVNEVQQLAWKYNGTVPFPGAIHFETGYPMRTEDSFKIDPENLPPATGPGSFQEKLEDLSNVGSGNVAVSGPTGGPYRVEFKGKFASTNVDPLQYWGSGHFEIVTLQEGDSGAEICTAAHAADCAAGVEWTGQEGSGDGIFGHNNSIVPAVGPGGEVHVLDEVKTSGEQHTARVQLFESSGAFKEEHTLFEAAPEELGGGLALASSGSFYVSAGGVIHEYDSSGVELESISESGVFPGVLSFDSAGQHLFAATAGGSAGGSGRAVTEYDSSGTILSRFGYSAIGNPVNGLAAYHTAAGDVFISQGTSEGVKYLKLPPPGPVATLPKVPYNEVASTKASLHAEVNPEDGAGTKVHFEYLTQEQFEAQGESFTGPATKSTAVQTLGAEDFNMHAVEAHIGCPDPVSEAGQAGNDCLIPETTYRWRIVAENTDGTGEGTLAGEPLETTPPLEIEGVWPTEVGTDMALLHAEVNPLGIPTTGYFQYISDAAYQANVAAAEAEGETSAEIEALGIGFTGATRLPASGALDFGAGYEPVVRDATAFPLQEGAAYHVRLLASDPLLAEPVPSGDRDLLTLAAFGPALCGDEGGRGGLAGARTGAAAFLPDCRAYEMVSPPDKNNSDVIFPIRPDGYPSRLEQASSDGSAMSFSARNAFAGAEGAPWTSQYIAVRHAGEEWHTHAISSRTEHNVLKVTAGLFSPEFEYFSPNLCEGWLHTFSDPALAEGAIEGNLNIYRRTDNECGGPSYEALTTIREPHVVPDYQMMLQGVSADGQRTIFKATDTLAGTGAPPEPGACVNVGTCLSRLYSHSAAEGTRFICILPDGQAAESCAAGTTDGYEVSLESNLEHAISTDGTRIFWSAPAPGLGKIYMRDSHGTASAADDTTMAVSAAGEALSETSSSQFWCAAADGSKAVFTTGSDLYEFYPEGEVTHLIAHEVPGLAGCSEDASRIYFATNEALKGSGVTEENGEGAKAVAGQPNLYLYQAAAVPGELGSYAFIGTLSKDDSTSGGRDIGPLAVPPSGRLTRVTPSGGALAFMSRAPLTGFENIDAQTGETDMEVFLYDAASRQLVCASCNPTGTRPIGFSADPDYVKSNIPAAARIRGWEDPFYAPRWLSEDGRRLFFETDEQLVARDTNGHADVYEWEVPGEGSCSESSLAYSPSNGGCIDLISSGLGETHVEFLDASPSGQDVFFTTAVSLLPQDPGQVDLYDARVGGGLPTPPEVKSGCEGEACQYLFAAPSDRTPASEIFKGPGNLSEAPILKKQKTKTKTKASKRKGCLAARREVKGKGKARCAKRHAAHSGKKTRRKRRKSRHSDRRKHHYGKHHQAATLGGRRAGK